MSKSKRNIFSGMEGVTAREKRNIDTSFFFTYNVVDFNTFHQAIDFYIVSNL